MLKDEVLVAGGMVLTSLGVAGGPATLHHLGQQHSHHTDVACNCHGRGWWPVALMQCSSVGAPKSPFRVWMLHFGGECTCKEFLTSCVNSWCWDLQVQRYCFFFTLWQVSKCTRMCAVCSWQHGHQ